MWSTVWTVIGLSVIVFTVPCYGEFLRVCYMTNWSQYRPGDARFTVSSISDVSLCTHIILAFAEINATENNLAPLEPNDDIPGGTYHQLAELRDSNPGLKVLLAVGGWNHGSEPFVEVVSDVERMNVFTDNVVSYIRRINFDGVDIDWEWPAHRGSNSSDKQRFTSLLQTLKRKIAAESAMSGRQELLLTIAVGAPQSIVDAGYEVDKISRVVDFLSIMTYDMNIDARGHRLLHHSPLYSRPGDPYEERRYSVDFTVNYWLNKGAPRGKVVVGLPFYGRYYRLLYPDTTDLYDLANGTSDTYPYYQICQFAKSASWTRVWDNVTKVPVIYSNDKWVGYDDIHSMDAKATYIREQRLRGAMVWEIGQDDFTGRFCNQGRFPLLNKITEVLTASKDDCEPGTYGSVTEPGCTPCRRGSYQAHRRRTKCELCGSDTTTYSEGTKAQYKCIEKCPLGTEYHYLEEKCLMCGMGFKRSEMLSAYCTMCPDGYTTMTEGDITCVPLPDGVPVPKIMDLMYHFTLTFTTETCANIEVTMAAISSGVWKVMKETSVTWPEICRRGCDNVKTLRIEGCDGEGRRDSHLTNLTVRGVIEEVPEVLKSAPDDEGVTITRTTDSVVTELYFDKDIFKALNVYGIQYTGMTERTMEKLCSQTGYVFDRGQCVPCSSGHYKQISTRRCIVCPVGTYQDKEAQTQCEDCPGPTTTLVTGADTVQKCLSPCVVDTNYCENNGVCQWRAESLKVYCQCEEQYYGERCNNLAVQDGQKDLVPIIGGIAGGLGSVFVVIFVTLVCCLCYRRQSRSQNDSSRADETKDVLYVPSVLTSDYLQTPTIIATDPYYYDNSFMITDYHRSRAGIGEDTFKTPTVISLDPDSFHLDGDKADKKAPANDKTNGKRLGSDANDDNERTAGGTQPSNDQTVINTAAEVESVPNDPKPVSPVEDNINLYQRM